MKQCKRLAALLLCLVLLAATIPSASAYTAGDSINVYLDLTALLSLPEHNLTAFPWMATRYCTSAENGNTLTTSGDWIYCIDYYNKAQQGVVTSDTTNLVDTTYWRGLSWQAQRGITYALIYGCPNYSNEFFGYAATQLIIWEYQAGARLSASQSCDMFATTLASNSCLKANYDGILAQIALHQTPPSFDGQSVTLNGYGRANGVTITDTNGTFRNDQWSIAGSNSGVVIEQTGDNLFIYATEALSPNQPVNIGLQRKLLVATGNALCVMSAAQHAVLGTPPDPLAVSLSVQVNATSSLKIKKTSEDGVVAGITFRVTGANGYDQTAITNDAGELLLQNLLPGTYTVTEQNAPERYEPQQPQTVTVTANATAEVTFSNVLKRGSLKIRKTSEDGIVAGITFRVTGANGYDQTATTNDAGELLLQNLLPGTYTVTEQDAPDRYAPQKPQTITVKADAVAEITFRNTIKRGTVYGKKVDPDGGKISGAVFGLFPADETEFTKETAVQLSTSDENGRFAFADVLYGDWTIKELEPADGFLPNEKIYPVTISEDAQRLEIIAVNHRVPEIHTTADVDGEKAVGASGVITLTDTVSYKHLIPGKEYTLTGKLMDKATGKAFLLDGKEITSEVTFTPDEPDGEIEVEFTFDARLIQIETNLVVFEGLHSDGIELAVHADIEDEGQTVTIIPPEIHTTATIGGKKDAAAAGTITIEDVVKFEHLIPGKKYTVLGELMDKSTGKSFLVDGKPVTAEAAFTPEKSSGEVRVQFTFDAAGVTEKTDLVVFEALYHEKVLLAVHADIEDEGQTVTITPPETPKTDDTSHIFLWGILCGAAALGALAIAISTRKRNTLK